MTPTQLPGDSDRELQLELVRVRAEAAAARLEARAAEIELMLIARRGGALTAASTSSLPVAASPPHDLASSNHAAPAAESEPPCTQNHDHQRAADALIAAIHQLLTSQRSDPSAAAAEPTWDIDRAARQPHDDHHDRIPSHDDASWATRLNELQQRIITFSDHSVAEPTQDSRLIDAPEHESDIPSNIAPSTVPTPTSKPLSSPDSHTLAADETNTSSRSDKPNLTGIASAESLQPVPANSFDQSEPAFKRTAAKTKTEQVATTTANHAATLKIQARDRDQRHCAEPLDDRALRALECADPAATASEHRPLRPAAWLISTVAHAVVLLILGLLSLASQRPRDQLAFSAAVSETSAEVQTFTIEASEAPPDSSQEEPNEQTLEVSPMGVIPVVDLALDLPTIAPAVAMETFSTQANSISNLSQALKGDTSAKVQFAGVEGGGNHFIYLVDSSKSMRNFNEARNELLRSVEALQAHQRFYVVFYDQNPDYMRLAESQIDEPSSVLATAANKRALRQWAMTIQQQPGKSPTEVLPFAFKLRPDVIFLLSDGEFAAQTEEVIRKHNRRDNLFGETGPISIIHTIRYPGYSAAEARNAEEQMKRIAAENGGQYRNIVIQ